MERHARYEGQAAHRRHSSSPPPLRSAQVEVPHAGSQLPHEGAPVSLVEHQAIEASKGVRDLAEMHGRGSSLEDNIAGPSKTAPHAASSTELENPTRSPTPWPSALRKKRGISSSTDKKYATSPARLESTQAAANFAFSSQSPRPSSVVEGKGKGKQKAIEAPSKQDLELWTKLSAASLHPGFNFHSGWTSTLRDSPLHRGPKELRMQNIDSVISPSLSLSSTASASTSRPSLPVEPIESPSQTEILVKHLFPPTPTVASPLEQTSHLITTLTDTSSFRNLPEYTGWTPSPVPRRAGLPRPVWSPVSEGRERQRPVRDQLETRVEVAEMYRDFVWGRKTAGEDEVMDQGFGYVYAAPGAEGRVRESKENVGGKGLVGRVRGWFKKRAVGHLDGNVKRGQRMRADAFGRLKQRVTQTGRSVGKMFGQIREG